jgi:chromosome segregation ATPase
VQVVKVSGGVLTHSRERRDVKSAQPHAVPVTKQVEEIKDNVNATFTETDLPEKVSDLRIMLDNLSEEVDSWRTWHQSDYLGVIETLKSQVEEIQTEWGNVSNSITVQHEKLESLLQSVPGVIETATLKSLSLRVTHLEQLISQLFNESQLKTSTNRTRKQLIISTVALGVTVVLWGVFIVMNFIR